MWWAHFPGETREVLDEAATVIELVSEGNFPFCCLLAILLNIINLFSNEGLLLDLIYFLSECQLDWNRGLGEGVVEQNFV